MLPEHVKMVNPVFEEEKREKKPIIWIRHLDKIL